MNYQHTINRQIALTEEEHFLADLENVPSHRFVAVWSAIGDIYPDLELRLQRIFMNKRLEVCRIKRMH